MAARTLLTLVRHGETSANLDGVWHGSTDTPLTPRGERQATRVAAFLGAHCADASAIYCSPLQRARRTAEAIGAATGLALRLEPDLREYDLGGWEGKRYADLFHEHRFWHHIKADPDYAPHGGESPRAVADRFTGALLRIARDHEGTRTIVVTHGGALSMALGQLLDGNYTEWKRVMDNCAVTDLALDGPPELVTFNQTTHLEGV